VIRCPQEKWGKEFVDCMHNLEGDDISYTGCFHTWTNNQSGKDFVSKKLDRILSNCDWTKKFGNTTVEFLERGISDHSLALVAVSSYVSYGPKPFKFFNHWADHSQILEWIGDAWKIEVDGYSMFQFYAKLKAVRALLKSTNKEVYGGLGQRVMQARQDLAKAQSSFISSRGYV